MNKKDNIYTLTGLLLVMLFFISCKRNENQSSLAEHNGEEVLTFPLPDVPSDITDSQLRVEYILNHFWDPMDFRDTILSYNEDILAQNFVNFISIFPYANEDVQLRAASLLLEKAKVDTVAFRKLWDTIDRYLYDVNSPMLSEEFYIPFLKAKIASPFPGNVDGKSAALTLNLVMKNRPATKAADFRYITREGKEATLHTTPAGEELILFFYDPTCENCKEIVSRLQNDERLNNSISEGVTTFLAISTGGDKNKWDATKGEMPSNWIVGYEPGVIDREDLYILRASPTVYLLSGDTKEVIGKDISL